MTLPADATEDAVPVSMPVQGSDGSVATLTTTETIFLTTPELGTPQANVLVDDVACTPRAARTRSALGTLPADRQPALKSLVDLAASGDGSAAIAGSLALGSGVSPLAATLAGRAFGGSLAAFASGAGADHRVAASLAALEPAPSGGQTP